MFNKNHRVQFDSSIADDPIRRSVFNDMCCLADWNGVVDMTYEAIAGRTRWPIETLVVKIAELMQPDPQSKSRLAEGARLVLLEPGVRNWGWKVVNYEKWRNIKSPTDRAVYKKLWMQKHRAKKRQPPVDKPVHGGQPVDNGGQGGQSVDFGGQQVSTREKAKRNGAKSNYLQGVLVDTCGQCGQPVDTCGHNKNEIICYTHTETALSIDEARSLLTSFSRKHFIRVPSAAQWHNLFDSYVQEAMPISRKDLEALDWFYGLEPTLIEELKTGLRREFANVMSNLPGEIQKAYAAEKQLRPELAARKKNDPPKWREFLRARYGEDIRLPADFEELDRDLQAEYEKEIANFEEDPAT